MLDALGDLLNPYSEYIGAAAGIVATCQSFSGAVFINDIRKRGSADGFDATPFIGGIIITSLALKLALIVGDGAMTKTHIIGLLINSVYLAGFYYYTSKQVRPSILKKLGIGAIFATTCITYATFEDPAKIEARFGILLTAMFVILIGAPLFSFGDIIRQKSHNLPFPMILTGTTMGLLWLTYAISIKNRTIIYQNTFMLVLSLPQLIICLIYPSRAPSQVKTSDKEAKKD